MPIVDPLLPALKELLGPGARDIVGTAVSAGGGTLHALDRRQVLYHPGRRASVRFAARVGWGRNEPVDEAIVAIADVDGPPAGTLALAAGAMSVGLFRYPEDPALPGLRTAVTGPAVAARLGVPADRLALTVVTYRPGRRAVVRARIDRGDVGGPPAHRYLKVVPPAELPALVARLRALRGHVPVPEVLATWDDLGTVVLDALPGRTVRDILLTGSRADVDALPGGREVLDLLERLPVATSPGEVRPSGGPVARVAGHAGLLAAILPDEAGRVAALVDRIGPVGAAGPIVPTHGDLHDGQVLVRGADVVGMLDVDGAGMGRRAHDLGMLLGHLVALGEAAPRRRAVIDRWRSGLQPDFEGAVGRDELRRTTAAALVGLASGPFRVQQPGWRRHVRRRLRAAEAWAAEGGADGPS
jgi:hypothetical protein